MRRPTLPWPSMGFPEGPAQSTPHRDVASRDNSARDRADASSGAGVSELSVREQRVEHASLSLPRGFTLELPAREQAEAQRLACRHRRLFGLDLVGDIDERSCWRRDRHGIAPRGGDLLVVGVSVEDDTQWATESSVP